MTEIINFIARELEQALARGLAPDEARQAAEVATRHTFAGERVYIAGHPKRQRAVQIAALNLGTTREVVAATGMNQRTVRRILRGR